MTKKDDKLIVSIDYTEERDRAVKEESLIECEADIIHSLENGRNTDDVATDAIVSTAMGLASGILRPFKPLLLTGAMQDISSKFRKVRTEVHTSHGTYSVVANVGRVRETELVTEEAIPLLEASEADTELAEIAEQETTTDDGPSYVKYDNPLADERDKRYLTDIVPGHIFPRFLRIYERGGNVRAAADELKRKVDELVEKIV